MSNDSNADTVCSNRRNFLGMGALATFGALVLPAFSNEAMAAAFQAGTASGGSSRRVSFRNTHTNESFSGVYRIGNKYLPDAFDRINYVMRDHRTGEAFPIDPRVMDIIYSVHQMTGNHTPYDVLSGYRCPQSNAGLRKASGGVAKNSLHMTGQAIDLRMPNYSTSRLRDLAKSLRAGGVGYYSRSNFVHMDSGDVRYW